MGASQVIDRISDEKSRHDVNGIVQMPEKDDCPEEDRGGDTEYPQAEFFPICKGHEKRKSGMRREEEVGSGAENEEIDLWAYAPGIDENAVREWADVCERYEERPGDDEEGNYLQHERQTLRIGDGYGRDHGPEDDRPVDEKRVHIKDPDIGEYYVWHGASGAFGGVSASERIDDERDYEEDQACKKRSQEFLF